MSAQCAGHVARPRDTVEWEECAAWVGSSSLSRLPRTPQPVPCPHNMTSHRADSSAEPSLWKLSSLGHFLKGSSAALGIIKVQNSCEKMQHYGNLRDEEVGAALSEDEALKRIKSLLVDCKRDYAVASRYLRQLYASYDE